MPAYTALDDENDVNRSVNAVREEEDSEKRPPPIGFVKAILLPSVLAVSLNLLVLISHDLLVNILRKIYIYLFVYL